MNYRCLKYLLHVHGFSCIYESMFIFSSCGWYFEIEFNPQ